MSAFRSVGSVGVEPGEHLVGDAVPVAEVLPAEHFHDDVGDLVGRFGVRVALDRFLHEWRGDLGAAFVAGDFRVETGGLLGENGFGFVAAEVAPVSAGDQFGVKVEGHRVPSGLVSRWRVRISMPRICSPSTSRVISTLMPGATSTVRQPHTPLPKRCGMPM